MGSTDRLLDLLYDAYDFATKSFRTSGGGGGGGAVTVTSGSINVANTPTVTDTAVEAVLGTTAGAAVTTDVNGTVQQYLRGIIKSIAANLGISINTLAVGTLLKAGTTCEIINCTPADTDCVAAGGMPAGTKYLSVYTQNDAVIAMGEATSTTKGIGIGAGSVIFPVNRTGTAADDTIHVQSSTNNNKVRVTYLAG